MLLILISWIYILFTTINLGYIFDKSFKINSNNFAIKSIFGLFSTTILATIWAFFNRINIEFHIFFLALNILIFWKFSQEIKTEYKLFICQLKNLSKNLKIILIVIFVLIIAQCATAPFLADNESYYIQTIKWINHYGLVKGLVNLHIFFGQSSVWHICQSVFNFSFLYNRFNDLSGFCLLLGNVFAIQKLNDYFENGNKNNLLIGLFPIFNVLFFRFISSPSTDIPVYVISTIVFYHFLKNFKTITIENFKLLTTLVLFILFIKTTSIAIILIPIFILAVNYKILIKNIIPLIFFSLLILSLCIIKNVIISGYPFYPLPFFGFTSLDYSLPSNLLQFLLDATKADAYWIDSQQYKDMSFLQLSKIWFTSTIIDAFFNFTTLITLFVSPLIIYKFRNENTFWILYFIIFIQMIIMFFTSPQYRYFIHFILFLNLLILSLLSFNKSIIFGLNYLSIIMIIIVLLFPLNFNKISNNYLIAKNENFSLKNFIFPHSNSSAQTKFVKIYKGNLKFYSPIENSFFWGNGNGNLPCVNEVQLNYFEKYYYYIPQLRTKNLKDGFYAKKKYSSPNLH